MTKAFTIRQLTKEFGVTARALRFYEEEELIAPARREEKRALPNQYATRSVSRPKQSAAKRRPRMPHAPVITAVLPLKSCAMSASLRE